MPNFDLINQPRYQIITHDSNDALTADLLKDYLSRSDGITLCIRSEAGHPDRGGYFFCISKKGDNMYELETIEGVHVDTFSEERLLTLINHASGRVFDSEMLDYCQNSINFRTD